MQSKPLTPEEVKARFKTLYIGQIIKDEDNMELQISNKTTNSVEVAMKKKTDKGIDCKQWFEDSKFFKRFKTLWY